jgi:integrase
VKTSKVEVKRLTALAVANYKPRATRRMVRDIEARSLFLVVHPTGTKSWQMRFRTTGGRIGKITLGPVDLSGRELKGDPQLNQPLTLAAARSLAASVHRQRALGRDPIADARAQAARRRHAAVEGEKNTFGVCAKDYVEKHASKKIRRWRELSRLLGLQPTDEGLAVIAGGLAQRWGDRPATEIDGHDVHAVVSETRERGAPGLQRRADGQTETRAYAMHSCLSGMFRWLLRHRRVERNPCTDVHRPDMPANRERKLSDEEIVAFWRATDEVGGPCASVLQLLLLTGCRREEIARLRRDELSANQIALPPGRTKNHRAHVVSLSPLAQQIIAGVPRVVGCPFVFSNNGRTAVSGWSKIKARLDASMEKRGAAPIPPWRIHDLRRTCASGMQKLGVRAEVIERCLNHLSGSFRGVAGIYQRDPMTDECAAALLRWSQHVAGLVSGQPANVVRLRHK